MELYWPQHKVFFIATLALFPDRLNGHEVNQWFYRPYCAGDDPHFIEIELEDYQKAGYLKYEKPGSLYKITGIDTGKAKKDLLEYLKQWQHNELGTPSASKPPDAVRQKELLQAAIVHDYPDHKNEQRITLENVYGKPSDYAYRPPFWELVLSCQLLDKKIVITYMDYDRREDGLYDDGGQPTVDFKIVDEELLSWVEQQAAQITKRVPSTALPSIVTPPPKSNTDTQRAWIRMPDKHVFAELGNGDKHQITKQKKGLRTDLAPYSLIKFLIKHPTATVTLSYANEKIDGCENVDKLNEVIRQCGFDEAKKIMFFEVSTATKVKLKEDVYLSAEEVAILAK
jgi:hypothetical protein